MAFLKFEDIDKSFGENNVISKFNLKVEKTSMIKMHTRFENFKKMIIFKLCPF